MDIYPPNPNIPKPAILAKLHIDCLQLNGAILLEKTEKLVDAKNALKGYGSDSTFFAVHFDSGPLWFPPLAKDVIVS